MKPPCPLRDFELELMRPHLFKGAKILELGNKKNSIGVYKDYLTACGYVHVSVDINGLDGALALDLREPVVPALLARGLPVVYDMLTNSGVTEHVLTDQQAVWRNCYELVRVGGVQVHVSPAANHWMRHGFYHPTEQFYRVMAKQNGMRVLHLAEYRWTPGKVLTRCVLRKDRDAPFVYPGDELLCKTDRYYARQKGEVWAKD
jgi:hypothetical protein